MIHSDATLSRSAAALRAPGDAAPIHASYRGNAMLKLHHLNNSRSQRIIWLLEELGVPYELVKYQRMTPVPLAPPELKQVHPLGKSPVIEDNGLKIAESGAEVEYIIDTYGKGKLKPAKGSADYWKYIEWMHFAEGSAMLPLLMALYTSRLGDAAAPLKPRVDSEIDNHLSYMDAALGSKNFFVGNELTGADIMLIFVVEAAGARLEPYKNLVRYRDAIHARPAYQRSIEKGGPYQLMSR
ncbi:MAG TPA: glutathione S-transferase [Rhizomicrobium sp.]|jgi:glutathione S-transferase